MKYMFLRIMGLSDKHREAEEICFQKQLVDRVGMNAIIERRVVQQWCTQSWQIIQVLPQNLNMVGHYKIGIFANMFYLMHVGGRC